MLKSFGHMKSLSGHCILVVTDTAEAGLLREPSMGLWYWSSPGMQSPGQRMIGLYNHLQNVKYLKGSITILRRWVDPYRE